MTHVIFLIAGICLGFILGRIRRPAVLERFNGVVDSVEDGIAYVTLTADDGETLEGEYPANDMERLGIVGEGARFAVTTRRHVSGRVSVDMEPAKEPT